MNKSKAVKTISVTKFDEIMKQTYVPTTIVEWNGVEIEVKKTLSLSEAMTFVRSVTQSCFEAETNAYLPEVKDFAIKSCILEMYSNFSMPSNVEHKYELIYHTDAVDVVVANVNNVQLRELIDAINDKVDNAAQSNIESIHKQMSEIYNAFSNLEEKLGDVLSTVNKEEIAQFMSKLSTGEFSAESLVSLYMDYTKKNKSGLGE